MHEHRLVGGLGSALGVATAIFLGIAVTASAEVVTYQQGDGKGSVSETDDTTMSVDVPDTTWVDDGQDITHFEVDTSTERHTILKFPNIFGDGANQIPLGSLILSATLTLNLDNEGTDCPDVYQMTEGWTEAEATWNSRRTGVSWSDPGADGTTSHKAVSEGSLPCLLPLGFKNVDVITNVQNWSNGELNEGWVFVDTGASSNGSNYRSSEHATLGDRPQLQVSYLPSVFYSVGTNTADLKTGSPSITIASGVATLDVPQTNDIGLGDVIDYDSPSNLAYIWDVVSSTQFRVQTATGTVPGDLGPVSVNTIKRAFNSISQAVTESSDAAHLNDTSLVAAGRSLTWVCYNDGPLIEASTITIDGYTTDVSHYITLTVAGASQVVTGNSQRHDGTAFTGTNLTTTSSDVMSINDPYTVIEWLIFKEWGSGGTQKWAIDVDVNNGVRVRQNIFYGGSAPHDTASAIQVDRDDHFIYNNIVYNLTGTAGGRGIWNDTLADNVSYINNTVYNCRVGFQFDDAPTDGLAINNISVGNTTDYTGVFHASSTNNLDSDGSAPPAASLTATAASLFVSLTFPENLHLRSGAAAIDAGSDQSGIFSNDIDDQPRPFASSWDIGADETPLPSATTHYRSVGITAADLNTSSRMVAISGWTATFDGSMPDNVGVGDALTYASGGNRLAFIVGRSSSTVFSVTDKDGAQPTATGNVNVGVYRAYNALADWESGTENPNILEPTPGDVNPSTDLITADTIMMVACYGDGEDTGSVFLDSWDTGPNNYIRIYTPVFGSEVGVSQRHNGTWDTSAYRLSQDASYFAVMGVRERYVRIDGLQLNTNQIVATESNGIHVGEANSDAPVEIHISNNIVRTTTVALPDIAFGIGALNSFGSTTFDSSLYVAKVWNNVVYGYVGASSGSGIYGADYGTMYAYNNTVVGTGGATHRGIAEFNNTVVHAKNNISIDSADPYQGTFSASSTNNFSDLGDAPGLLPKTRNGAGADPVFVGGVDYHLDPSDTWAQGQAADLSGDADLAVFVDIDFGIRQTPWDIGADDVSAVTAVELVSFEAVPADSAVTLEWETGSELKNLGFHLYRSPSADGPYERVTSQVIPGLGNSPVGANYVYRDEGLANGTTYFYELEDIDSTGLTERHGPVSATPRVGASSGDEDKASLIIYGRPSANAFRVVKDGRFGVTLELSTEGFHAEPQEDGTVRLEIPGFESLMEVNAPGIPVHRAWVEAVAGRKVELQSVSSHEVEAFSSLRPTDAELPELVASADGTVRARRKRGSRQKLRTGMYPAEAAQVTSVGFQGDVKKALVELAPLRWDGTTGQLMLARRLVVRLSFHKREPSESTTDGLRGRRRQESGRKSTEGILARLQTAERGLYAVGFEEVFGRRARARAASTLRLSRQGDAIAYHLEPSADRFGPGSTLYFVSEGASVNRFGNEAVYELELARGGKVMEEVDASPSGKALGAYWQTVQREENRYYQAGLVDAPDLWLWELLFAPETKGFAFDVTDLASTAESSHLRVWLQGASDFSAAPDHHVRLYLNGTFIEEMSWDGKRAQRIDSELHPGFLREGENLLEIESVGDTGADYSMVMLDRFEVSYPRLPRAVDGRLEGSFSASGVAEVSGLLAGALLVDTTKSNPRWLNGARMGDDGVARARVDSGGRYLVVSPDALLRPLVTGFRATGLRNEGNGADYLLVAPEEFLPAAAPLLALRRSEGLRVKAVSMEDIVAEFGFGEATPEALKDFLSYAYHQWQSPSPRYVVLLGDATYDFKDYLGTGVHNRVPPLMVKTSYLWTASDPSLAAVNGDDILPDFAIGRLPAATLAEARAMVDKIVAYETGDAGLTRAPIVLVADNPDGAGDFEADADEIATALARHDVRKLYLRELGASATRDRILQAFDEGASLVNYVGHGGIYLWAGENVFNISDAPALTSQAQQPLLVTMNCLNGYFHFPYFNSLAEELLKAEDRGAIAAFSPTGLSLDGPAHLYHQALLQALFSGQNPRIGDAVLEAQESYARTGAFPELLSIYHLLGDPALNLR